jgi:5'(3')-deoxyribonucleotidase
MNNKVLALDLESVLADIHTAWITHYNKPFTNSDIQDWDFHTLSRYNESLETFLKETDALWKNEPYITIPPIVNDPKKSTNHLKPFDIVTSRGTLGGVKEWLDYHEIEYRAIVYIAENKSELNYDVFVDDNPNLALSLREDQFLWLISRPYNQHLEESSHLRRVSSILDVVNHHYKE